MYLCLSSETGGGGQTVMSLEDTLQRINADISRGSKFKAADRLRNLIQQHPNNLELWNQLAELYYESGFLDAAGKYWILIEPTEERIKQCVEIYEKSVNYSGYQILNELVFKGEKSELPKYAQEKLTQLEQDSKEKKNYVPDFRIRKKRREQAENSSSKDESFFKAGCLLLFLFVCVIIVLGVITLFKMIF